jgi:hypothetical protein
MKDVRFNLNGRLFEDINDPLYYRFRELGLPPLRSKYQIKTLYDLCCANDCTRQLTTLKL